DFFRPVCDKIEGLGIYKGIDYNKVKPYLNSLPGLTSLDINVPYQSLTLTLTPAQKSLTDLRIRQGVISIEGFHYLKSLVTLDLSDSHLKKVTFTSPMVSLITLLLPYNFEEIEGFEHLTNLKKLAIRNCSGLNFQPNPAEWEIIDKIHPLYIFQYSTY